jgi:hypothetical protein
MKFIHNYSGILNPKRVVPQLSFMISFGCFLDPVDNRIKYRVIIGTQFLALLEMELGLVLVDLLTKEFPQMLEVNAAQWITCLHKAN